jgi:hypothetical protein
MSNSIVNNFTAQLNGYGAAKVDSTKTLARIINSIDVLWMIKLLLFKRLSPYYLLLFSTIIQGNILKANMFSKNGNICKSAIRSFANVDFIEQP